MQPILDFIRDNPGSWALLIVYAAAAAEYLVPPLPADSIVLAGSLLVVAGAHSFATVFVFAVAGGATGAAIHYRIGRWCAQPDGSIRGQRYIERVLGKGSIDRFFVAFRKYGMGVIALNRAFPGVRAVTFFAAGIAGLPFLRVMAIGLISNLAWTMLILSLGVQVGGNWEKIQEVFSVYQKGVYAVAVSATVIYVAYRLWKRKKRSAP